MNKTNISCPKCGTNIELSVSKITSKSAAPHLNEAEEKIEALRKAGVNVSNLFSIRGKNGVFEVGRLEDGLISVVSKNDPIFNSILNSNTIPDRRLFRRWVMSQVFRMMDERDYKTGKPIGFTAALNRKGYKYQWKMVVEEMRVQAKLAIKDPENFEERNRWFNKSVVVAMGEDYIHQIEKFIDKLKKHRCKGVPYIRLNGRNIFVEDLAVKVFYPIVLAVTAVREATTPENIYKATLTLYQIIQKMCLRNDFKLSSVFKDAYKGAGAFFTLKNLILFHGCTFPGSPTKTQSLNLLNLYLKHTTIEGYKVFGVLKEFLNDNHINISEKRAEWRK